eukprot:TRINITY_DN9524_c0_g1_i1.p2 TRINITY_DN9524_c0_g1~~TRINITY_DN9524_c0_g1_i1.p2  ORF type:complete len:174 (+),score=15.24 TRINITY_DN9524_c0_g1_i1:62-583(+)
MCARHRRPASAPSSHELRCVASGRNCFQRACIGGHGGVAVLLAWRVGGLSWTLSASLRRCGCRGGSHLAKVVAGTSTDDSSSCLASDRRRPPADGHAGRERSAGEGACNTWRASECHHPRRGTSTLLPTAGVYHPLHTVRGCAEPLASTGRAAACVRRLGPPPRQARPPRLFA